MGIEDEMNGKLPKHIIFVTGTRADFGKLEPLAMAAKHNGFRVSFVVTGMHMLEKYGLTKSEVHNNGAFEVFELINHREGDPLDVILSKTITGLSDIFKETQPDLVVLHGDRIEAFACSIVCATNYILSAHVEGGEVSGTIDEQFRHCNTKLSSRHLVSSQEAKERVLRMGEAHENVHIIGSPELDIHGRDSGVSLTSVLERYEIKTDDYGICIFHPVTSELETIENQALDLFGALEESEKYFVVILPNNDPGSHKILQVIQKLPKQQFRLLPSMRFAYFSELMKNARVIVGNSSVGVREAPFLGVPSLDVGTRQENRANEASIFKANANEKAKIAKFIKLNWMKKYENNKRFGEGNASDLFSKLLLKKSFWSKSLQKNFVD